MKRFYFKIEGLVQGVGFRPFVYTLALKCNLNGYVLNAPEGVFIDLEGDEDSLERFEKLLFLKLPPLARIDKCDKEERELFGYKSFEIQKSEQSGSKHSAVLPDMSICDDCLHEMKEKEDFRYNYAFINCTNCGPRYSIIKTVPYDRPNTSMQPFKMCDKCKEEYENPTNRRYHAQPVSCSACGPTLSLHKIDGTYISKDDEALMQVADELKKGKIIAMKGMGGFHLLCSAINDEAIQTLRKRKKRPTKPFAIMCKDLAQVSLHVKMYEDEKKMLTSIQKPIVLIEKKQESSISDLVAPNIDRLGVFLPYTPLHVKLLESIDFPLIATSANASGEPIVKDAKTLEQKLSFVVDLYLDYNREIVNASDDSVMQLVYDKPLFMRLSRGFTPFTFPYKSSCKETILAVGAEQKNAIAIYKDGQIIQSPYIGDMNNVATFEFFERTIETFKRFYNLEFDRIICDKHPNYATTTWAKKQKLPLTQVQHHHAHILATMTEHGLNEEVLGVAWDGTGYGDDGSIWGGEFLLTTSKSYKRVGHLKPFKLLGADASVKEIRRIAYSMLLDIDEKELSQKAKEFMLSFPQSEQKLLNQMHNKSLNAPLCSSIGRLFDAVAAIATGLKSVNYDGESGLILENLYNENIKDAYNFKIDEDGIIWHNCAIISMFNDQKEAIATKFLNGLANCIIEMAKKYQKPVVLGGGVFQNKTLVKLLFTGLKKEKIPLYFPNKNVSNDGSIAFGQLCSYILAQ